MKVQLGDAVLASRLMLLSGKRVVAWNVSKDYVLLSTAQGQLRFSPHPIQINHGGMATVNDQKGLPHVILFVASFTPLSKNDFRNE